MLVVEPVQAAIWHCLNHYAFSDATLLAERLLAETETDEAAFLVATCYFRQGRVERAHHLLSTRGAHTPNTRFLLAKCAAELRRDGEAEVTLRGGAGSDPRKEFSTEETVGLFGDKAAFALQLLASIYRRSERRDKAAEADREALGLNPLLWSSFDSLVSSGEAVEPGVLWDPDRLDCLAHCTGEDPVLTLLNSAPPVPRPARQDRTTLVVTPAIGGADTPGPETPFLHCNSVSTPVQLGSPAQLSGITSLNITTESELSQSQSHVKVPAFMPPPLRPKHKRLGVKPPNFSVGAFSPSFGLLGTTPSPGTGVAAKLLEFSSPQVLLLSPAPHSPSPSPILQLKSSLPSTPSHPPLKASTPAATVPPEPEPRPALKRAPMGPKLENAAVPVALVPGLPANLITPSPGGNPPRRSNRLIFGNNSVKENTSKRAGKDRTKAKSRFSRPDKPLSENELNEKNARDSLKTEKDKLIDSDCKPMKPSDWTSSANLSVEAAKLQKASVDGVLGLLKQIGTAYQRMAQFNCAAAVKLLNELPARHARSTWVLALLGKCHFELAEYRESARYFSLVREQEPHRLDMLDYYSSALWQLQDEVGLSALAQELQRTDKLSPVTWCAAGNCFSQQKEHENAIKFFQRAVQVNPDFSYAWTLLGNEYVLVEELEKALNAFRTAVRLDHRLYNGWYGIGLTYYKQERFQLAEVYYKKALMINRYSPLLMCHVATVQHKTNNSQAALDTLNKAITFSPKNPLCKFERANILISLERYSEALEDLKELKQIVPKESAVYFSMGKVHKMLGNQHLALMNFAWASDLDPKGANNQIKDAMDLALNTRQSELGSSMQEAGEPMAAEETAAHHEDFPGEISEGFNPTRGENTDSVSSPGPASPRPGPAGPPPALTVPVLMNDSDDSL